ncbi:hypothetical protein [Streptomyces sp. NBRC 109706]|uniref:hypothetical protein n=1 Tax=Streptomyces sp. NBRC 109706 TaxID=1550035 RepID=UPI0007815FC2|nr:hypothetical protein [Streptomyces sp. NBRC 109706]
MKALPVRSGGLGTVTKTVGSFGGFAQQYEQEVLLHGPIGRDRALMFNLAEKLPAYPGRCPTGGKGRMLFAMARVFTSRADPR